MLLQCYAGAAGIIGGKPLLIISLPSILRIEV
jgi:hypothetical protein